MTIFVLKDGKKLGPFSSTQLKDQIQAGAVALSDVGWCEGQVEWKPLREIQTIVEAVLPAVPQAAPLQVAEQPTCVETSTIPPRIADIPGSQTVLSVPEIKPTNGGLPAWCVVVSLVIWCTVWLISILTGSWRLLLPIIGISLFLGTSTAMFLHRSSSGSALRRARAIVFFLVIFLPTLFLFVKSLSTLGTERGGFGFAVVLLAFGFGVGGAFSSYACSSKGAWILPRFGSTRNIS